MSQVDIARLGEAFAYNPSYGGTLTKPRVVWVHGHECTGCSTSVLGVFEDVSGTALYAESPNNPFAPATVDTATALDLAFGSDPIPRTFENAGLNVDAVGTGADSGRVVNIQDVVVDVIDLLYHETIMNAGGDLAYLWLDDFRQNNASTFVTVVEGSMAETSQGGAWGDVSTGGTVVNPGQPVPWCSIGMNDAGNAEHDFPDVVVDLAEDPNCVAVIAIGQCATFGGYPGCVSPIGGTAEAGFAAASQSGATGTYDHLVAHSTAAAAAKVVNVPGCPTNPWWFTLTVVLLLVELSNGGLTGAGPLGIIDTGAIVPDAVDSTRRLKAVYTWPLHGGACTRYKDFGKVFALNPGDPGCLQLLGCKGPSTRSSCTLHGWNAQQPENPSSWDYNVGAISGIRGGNCIAGGHPCMGCTEAGYPDQMVPFVVRP
jgi:hydrogenase small subunit